MPNYKNILLALDLKSEDDTPITDQAQVIAKSGGGNIHLIHVVEPIYSYGIPPGMGSNVDQWEKELEDSAKAELEKVGKKLSIPKERQYLAVGQIKRNLLKAAEEIHADLIIVGSHSRHGLSALFMGDTADDMLHNATCDVLAVHIDRS